MPVQDYGVLKGRVVGRLAEADDRPHYQIHVRAGTTDFRVAVNVRSRNVQHPELLFYLAEDFRHPLTHDLPRLSEGFHPLRPLPDSLALDYVRGNLFDRRKMRPLPHDLPGEENDLNEKLERYVRRAMSVPNEAPASLYVFGSRWGPQIGRTDPIFGFTPGNGVHNVHMNQGNPLGDHDRDNGVYQDGGLFLHFPRRQAAQHGEWVGIFLAFQAQVWHSQDTSGHPITVAQGLGSAHEPAPKEPDFGIRIIAGRCNDAGGIDAVLLMNTIADSIDLAGWHLADGGKQRLALSGNLSAGGTVTVPMGNPLRLHHHGGLLTLLSPDGLKVHGVVYVPRPTDRPGNWIVF